MPTGTGPPAPSARFSMRATWPRFMMFVNNRPRTGSYERPLQLPPPSVLGNVTIVRSSRRRREHPSREHPVVVPEVAAVLRVLGCQRVEIGRRIEGRARQAAAAAAGRAASATSPRRASRSAAPDALPSRTPALRCAIEDEQRAHLGHLRDGRYPPAVLRDVDQGRRGWQIPVPDVVVHELLEPLELAGVRIERDE